MSFAAYMDSNSPAWQRARQLYPADKWFQDQYVLQRLELCPFSYLVNRFDLAEQYQSFCERFDFYTLDRNYRKREEQVKAFRTLLRKELAEQYNRLYPTQSE